MHRRCEHIDKLQAGDDKRAVKIFVKNLDAKPSKQALRTMLDEAKAKLAALQGAFARPAAYLVA